MSDDFIERLRREAREAAEKAKQPKELEPWQIERQKEEERRAKNRALGMQYFRESGCQACCEKLAAFVNSQYPNSHASIGEYTRYHNNEQGYTATFGWDSPTSKSVGFRVLASSDGSLTFEFGWHGDGADWIQTVTLTEWRTNKQKVESALEGIFRYVAKLGFRN